MCKATDLKGGANLMVERDREDAERHACIAADMAQCYQRECSAWLML